MAARDLNLGDLAAFVQVVDSGSFTAAGRVLGKPTKQVSRQVRRLEDELGAALLHRTTRSVSATQAGTAFYARARQILDELEQATRELAPASGIQRSLRVAVPTLSVAAGLARWLRDLRAEHPGLSVQVTLTDEPVDLVALGFDLQLVAGAPAQTSFVMRRLLTAALPLAAHRSYVARHGSPERPEHLTDHECLRFLAGSPQAVWPLTHAEHGSVEAPVSGSLQSTASEVLYAALHEGLGIGICGRGYLHGEGRARGLVPVLPGWTMEPIPLFAIRPRTSPRGAVVEAFLTVARQGLLAWM